MDDRLDGVALVEKMSRWTFRTEIVGGVAKTPEFSALMSSGIETLTKTQKDWLRILLDREGIPFECTATDSDLKSVALAIATRAMDLR